MLGGAVEMIEVAEISMSRHSLQSGGAAMAPFGVSGLVGFP